jgi:hypothetical protein
MRHTPIRTTMIAITMLIASACAPPTPDVRGIIAGTTPPTMEDVYVAFLRDWSGEQAQVTVIDVMSDAELIDMAHVTCGALDRGATDEDMFDMMLAAFIDDPELETRVAEVATLTGAAIGAFCPVHRRGYDE